MCKVPSNVCRVKEASVTKPTPVSYLGYLVYTSDVNMGEFSISLYIDIFQNLENGRIDVWILLQEW